MNGCACGGLTHIAGTMKHAPDVCEWQGIYGGSLYWPGGRRTDWHGTIDFWWRLRP